MAEIADTVTAAGERSLPRPGFRPAAVPLAAALLLACVVLGTSVGPAAIAPDEVLRVVLGHVLGLDLAVGPVADSIVWQIRLPRVLLAGLVGGTLAFSGAAYQGVFRNPLADPYLLGVASGAGFAETAAIVAGLPVVFAGFSLLTLVGFAGAVASVLLAYSIARVAGRASSTTLILAGVAVSAINVAGISYLMIVSNENSLEILNWLLGGLNSSAWSDLRFILPYSLAAGLIISLHGRLLNVLQLPELEARQVGVDVERTRVVLLLAASLAAAAAVAVTGVIGFVGLIVPHAVRLLVGPDYRRLLPLSALGGASFLIVADLIARTVVSPGEVPVGVVTAFVGGPFFLYLLRRRRRLTI